jgi:hypothetical protein
MQVDPEIVSGMRAMAGRSLDAAEVSIERAADSALEAIRFSDQATAGLKQGATELQLKALEIAEANAQACLSYWREVFSLSAVADLSELNANFMTNQCSALWRQTVEFGHLTMKLAAAIAPSLPGLKSSSLSE